MVENFSEDFVLEASRYILRKEYRPTIFKSAMWLLLTLVAVIGLLVAGVVSKAGLSGLIAGVFVAATFMSLTFWFAYRQNLRFALLVYRNERATNVDYEVSNSECKVTYKGVQVTLPWRLLRSKASYGEYEVLAFRPSETYSSRAKAITDAVSRNLSGPELLGFPIFCVVPGPRTRYVFIPKALLNNNPHITQLGAAVTPAPTAARGSTAPRRTLYGDR
jgi:hypothetical protein